MFGLSTIGVIHTAFSVTAVSAAIICLLLDREISPATPAGRIYAWMTMFTCVTALGIFQHGGFGRPHVLALATLAVLGTAGLAGRGRLFGGAAPYVATVSYSLSFFLHLIPGLSETFTRYPLGAPLFESADDPRLQQIIGGLFVLFLICTAMQVRRLRFDLA